VGDFNPLNRAGLPGALKDHPPFFSLPPFFSIPCVPWSQCLPSSTAGMEAGPFPAYLFQKAEQVFPGEGEQVIGELQKGRYVPFHLLP